MRFLVCLAAIATVLLAVVVVKAWQTWTASQPPAGPVQHVKAKARSVRR